MCVCAYVCVCVTQVHFDSDNEGIGQVRNPIVSTVSYTQHIYTHTHIDTQTQSASQVPVLTYDLRCGTRVPMLFMCTHTHTHTQVLYLTEGVGGPTLVTPQAFNTPQLPTHGWLVHPRLNRLTVFRGDVLHGVIPGRASVEQPPATASSINGGDSSPPFRVTVMVALWEDIRVRRHPPGQFGAAMAWPVVTDTPTNPGPSTLTAANRAVTTANTGSQEQGEGKDKSHHSTAAERTSKPPSKRTRVQGQQGTSTQQTTGLEPTLTWPSLFSALPDTGTHAGALTGTGVASPLTLHGSVSVCEVTPEPVAPVWCDVCEGESRAAGCSVGQMVAQGRLPSYDACFQGF